MSNTIKITFIIVLVALCTAPLQAFNKEFKELLSSKELKRLESAEKLIAKGDAFIDDTKALEKEVEQLKNADGRIKTGKINKRNKKIAQIKTKAALYYEDGYKKYIDVLDDRLKEIEKSGNSEARQTRKDTKALEKKARKQYNKAENLSSPEKVIELLELAQQNQQQAIELQTKSILSLSEYLEEKPVLIAEEVSAVDSAMVEPVIAETTPLEQDTATVTAELPVAVPAAETGIVPVAAPALAMGATTIPLDSTLVEVADEPLGVSAEEATLVVTETPLVEETVVPVVKEEAPVNPDIFLTIQIMADKKKATDEQINSVYSGNQKVIEMTINDWYKYSIGKYQSLEKAKADMKSENIKGFIVAYNKNERISVKEAVTLLQGES
ncbi:MAG: hypothetical protein MI866_11475 [Bacteroidales bacterium]|nr:hypothetical protein [Bacteroidales bacterium]